MMVLLPGITSRFKKLVRKQPDRWGWFVTPRRLMLSVVKVPPCLFAVDNDCYHLGDAFDGQVFLEQLHKLMPFHERCLFVSAQDVLGDAAATLALLPGWSKAIRSLGFPVALVGQDGMEDYEVPWHLCDAFFVGGGTDWKLGAGARLLMGQAKAHGKWIHMGRVNSAQRMRYARNLGGNSIDGTEWAINPGRGIKWAANTLNEMDAQMALAL